MTSLTSYINNQASATISTADQALENVSTGATLTNHTSAVGTSTGWGEIYSQGNTGAWGAGGSAPAPSGHGWFDDGTTLEGKQFISGTWTATLQFNTNSGTVSGDIHCRAYLYNGSTYTLIADMVDSGVSFTTSTSNYTLTASGVAASGTFPTGAKLYYDLVMNVSSGGASNTTVKIYMANSTTTGATNAQIVTPGYQVGSTHSIIFDGLGGMFV